MLRTVLAVIAALTLLLLGRFAVMSSTAEPPDHLANAKTRLEACGGTPNCVSSQTESARHKVEPLHVTGPADAALDRALRAIESMPRSRVITSTDRYVHAEYRSLLFRFVDDLELLYDGDIPGFHVRSASRSGHSDLGVNRRRVEALRERLASDASG